MINKLSLKLLLPLLLFFVLACLPGTGFAAEETYQITEQQLTQLQADLTQLQTNNQQQEQLSTTQAQQLVTLKAQLTVSQATLATLKSQLVQSQTNLTTLKGQLQTSRQELQQAKTSLQAAQTSLKETKQSFKKYEQTVSNKHFGLGTAAGVINSKAVALASIEYDNKNMGYEVLGNKTDVIVRVEYRF